MADGQDTSEAKRNGDERKASQIQWDDTKMATNFANVVNIQGTREQVELFFGTNRTWNVQAGGPMEVDLTNRLILTPLAAKRMSTILNNVLREYEQRHGALSLDT
ncbi:DUF3467 domain-containing protein [Sulfitobacter sp. D35]|uniref:DUF3467 domain-containing protein n=1 Tax=Sulfitobacter sp. D35 TaxID=3083252 RepID=UPI00296F8B0F|nr:DUF3467 domain-containing protein [Sulfitobacter sp. D35]MDW4496656.1 DUF3467 domain-containing protein [Sulfitobacter sp. D35]